MKRTTIIRNRWLSLLEDEFALANGSICKYYHVQKADAVMAIAINNIQFEPTTFIVQQHRHPISQRIWQFPIGSVSDAHESAEIAAAQELEEETGVKANNFLHMGSFFADPGFSNQRVHVYVTSDIVSVGSQRLEKTEHDLISKSVTVKSLENMIETGEMGDSWGITGLHYLRKYLDQTA